MGWNPVKAVKSAWHSATSTVSSVASNIGSGVQGMTRKIAENINPAEIASRVASSINIGDISKRVASAVQSVTIDTGGAMKNVASAIGNTASNIANSEAMQKTVAITLNTGLKALPALGQIALSAGEGALTGALAGGSAGTVVPILGNLVGAIGGVGAGAVGMGVKEIISTGLPTLKSIWNDSKMIINSDLSEEEAPLPQISDEEYKKAYQAEYDRLYQEEYDRQYNALLAQKMSEAQAIAQAQAEAKNYAVAHSNGENNYTKLLLLIGAGYLLTKKG